MVGREDSIYNADWILHFVSISDNVISLFSENFALVLIELQLDLFVIVVETPQNFHGYMEMTKVTLSN